jgi:hypothetical protein
VSWQRPQGPGDQSSCANSSALVAWASPACCIECAKQEQAMPHCACFRCTCPSGCRSGVADSHQVLPAPQQND